MIVGSADQLYLNKRELPLRCVDGPIVQKPNCAKSASQSHINYRGATAWNSLSVEMCLIQTYNQFKSTQKKFIQNLLSWEYVISDEFMFWSTHVSFH